MLDRRPADSSVNRTRGRLPRLTICLLFLIAAAFACMHEPQGSPSGSTLMISSSEENDSALLRCVGDDPDARENVANFEPYAAVNPRDPKNVAAVWMAAGPNLHYVVRFSTSFDNGEHWSPARTLPLTACSGGAVSSLHV